MWGLCGGRGEVVDVEVIQRGHLDEGLEPGGSPQRICWWLWWDGRAEEVENTEIREEARGAERSSAAAMAALNWMGWMTRGWRILTSGRPRRQSHVAVR